MNATLAASSHLNIELLLSGIASDGFAVVEDFLPQEVIMALASEAKELQHAGVMWHAGIGRNTSARNDDSVRGDFIHWLDTDYANALGTASTASTVAQQLYLRQIEELRASLNQSLYLGLFEVENHFAIYPPGALYGKHLDQFQGNAQRQLSCVLYLNHDWQPEHGGQLRLYLDEKSSEPYRDIEPLGGRFIAFLSRPFWHEVLPTDHERISIAGWFKTRSPDYWNA